jgi:hypothetical protein
MDTTTTTTTTSEVAPLGEGAADAPSPSLLTIEARLDRIERKLDLLIRIIERLSASFKPLRKILDTLHL